MKKTIKLMGIMAILLAIICALPSCSKKDDSFSGGSNAANTTTENRTEPGADTSTKTTQNDTAQAPKAEAPANQAPMADTAADQEVIAEAAQAEPPYDAPDGALKANPRTDTIYNGEEYQEPLPIGDEEYLPITENAERLVAQNPLQTFSLKVDTASYRNVARYIESGSLPPADAVRIEEMINYFNYETPLKNTDSPFSVYAEVGRSIFDTDKDIAFVRVKARDIDRAELPACNLTFLIDSSGSMDSYDKLPLLKQSFNLLVDTLTERDTVSIVTYSGRSEVVLDSVTGAQKDRIKKAVNNLKAGGSTAGGEGINTAYRLAEKNFDRYANNRVILATDGDFNVGVSSVDELERLIAEKRASGVYLSILGVGTENLKDDRMETLAKNGNGNYSYIDSVKAAQKALIDELSANLYTIADDVKAQIEFNPALVESYRLIGYENRQLSNRDFNDDTKDAGEIGVGADVVLMFEIKRVDGIGLKYQNGAKAPLDDTAEGGDYADELFTVSIRYKDAGKTVSKLISEPVKLDSYKDFNTPDFNFALSVAAFGHILKNSEYTGNAAARQALGLAKDSLGSDKGGYRKDFAELVERYTAIAGR